MSTCGTQTEAPKTDAAVQAQEEAFGHFNEELPCTARSVSAAIQTEELPPPASSRATTASQQQQYQQQQQKPQSPRRPVLSPIASRPPSSSVASVAQPNVVFVDNNRRFAQYQESTRQQRREDVECTPMVYSYNPDPRLRAWQSLEHARLHKLGLSSKLSRRYNVARSNRFVPVGLHMRQAQQPQMPLPPLPAAVGGGGDDKKNDVAPFLTYQKPTCGYFFSRETDNRKIQHGLTPADLPKWRFNQG